MHGVKLYSMSDLSNGYQLTKLKEITDGFSLKKTDYSINEIIELYNITLFIKAGLFLPSWSEEEISTLNTLEPAITKLVAMFVRSITQENILTYYSELEWDYKEDYWALFEKFKIYQAIPPESIKAVLSSEKGQLYNFLLNKTIVEYYGLTIRELLLSDENNAELLLNEYVVQRDGLHKKVYFPNCLTMKDKEELIIRYINYTEANLNFLRIIIDTSGSSGLSLSNKTKLAAKRRVEADTKKFFETSTGFKYGVSVSFSESTNKESETDHKNGTVEYTYSTKLIEANMDYPTLLNNFIYLFNFADMQMRITLVSKQSSLGLIDRFMTIRPKNSYPTGMGFDQLSNLSNLQMLGYYRLLQRKELRLESIVEWFFTNYLDEEFGIKGFLIRMPSEATSNLEKCRSVLPELESVLKQYNLYVEDGSIDHELLQISSDHLFFRDVKTNIPKKYIYPTGAEFNKIAHYFFSDQSGLAYIEKTKSKYHILYDLLKNESLQTDDFHGYQQIELKQIIELGYLKLDDNGYIRFTNIIEIYILRDLYLNEVVSYWHYPSNFRSVVDGMIKRGLAEFESTLFSRSEQSYFNFHLNKAEFCNSLDLRNKYSHGTQPSDETSVQTHEWNYFIFLKLLILIIIKINDDLCLQAELGDLVNN